MPEGHSVHRIARQFALHFVGKRVETSSPQGRFVSGAQQLDGLTMTDSRAVGKNLFLEFDHRLWLRVHLGIYGAWDFAGDISTDAPLASADERGNDLANFEDSLHSIGAPRRSRLRMSEKETVQPELDTWPPEPVGQVRVRLLTEDTVADLRGPTACEVLLPEQVDAVVGKLGPDPMGDDSQEAEDRFTATVLKKPTPIGLLLMDQSVVSGIGNVYRAELLYRARLDPHTPGKRVPEETVRSLWRDWVHLLHIGVETGHMLTMDYPTDEDYRNALANSDDRHWVYQRAGLPCRTCGTHILMDMAAGRKLYWCPNCQR
ncbi:Fpg/Nei family DNA glycosylase [Cryobacterium sp. BB736]|uniref:Fpg/Nei family DNA glycosylase n=1 Tax=Cryobacterium sp. BB736 TaxID=2746963 RepID=UPI001875B7B5|nr:DNA-formamidopyrimidine glycosylase family protein [Cryobacterium sp. BB736]